MIGVEVGDEHLVDFRDAGIFHCGLDALGVAAVAAGPAGIDEQRSARGRDDKRGLSAFDVDGVNQQIAVIGGVPAHLKDVDGRANRSRECAGGEQEREGACMSREATVRLLKDAIACVGRRFALPESVTDAACLGGNGRVASP